MNAEKSEIHKFLVEDLSEQRKSLVDFAFKHGTLTMLLLGWIITSKDAHELIPTSEVMRFGLVAIVIGYAILYAGWVLGMLQVSRDTCAKIDQNEYMDRSLYSHVTISSRLAWSYILMQCSLCAWMAIFICFLRPIDTKAPNQAMQRTASQPAIYVSSYCHPRVGRESLLPGLAVADPVSR
jgi:hypothetical protein